MMTTTRHRAQGQASRAKQNRASAEKRAEARHDKRDGKSRRLRLQTSNDDEIHNHTDAGRHNKEKHVRNTDLFILRFPVR